MTERSPGLELGRQALPMTMRGIEPCRSRSFSIFLQLAILMLMVLPHVKAQSAGNPIDMVWDAGAVDGGSQVVSQPATSAGSYYFRINTKSSEVWRSRLTVTSGEAHLYLRRGQIPVPGEAGVFKSEVAGSDGIVLSSADFAPGESWYLLVVATGATNAWSLVSGAPHVIDLGSLPFTDNNGDGGYTLGEPTQNAGVTQQVIPPEGVVFFKVTLPLNVPAWSLWLNGGDQLVGVRKSKVPVLFATKAVADRMQNGSLLLVPPYLGQGSDSYFVSVSGAAGSEISLDSRIQQVETMAFNGAIPPVSVNGPPYKVYKVEVPSGHIVWDLALNRVSGDPSIAIKKESVPAETENDAVSEAPGDVNDSISIVAPVLTDGTWYVTVYGKAPYETGIVNGPPVITDIGYRDTVTNDQPLRTGWRYYRVPDFGAQVGTLGWEMALKNAVPGSEIALRRTQIPGIWKKRTGGSTNLTEVKYADASSKTGILQRVDHEADIWYVGVYQPNQPLGAFILTLNDIQSTPIALDGSTAVEVDQVEGSWKYYRVTVPDDQNLLGWYVDLVNVSGTVQPKITVRRDRLPPSNSTVGATSSDWPSGASWSQTTDFTGQMTNADGTNVTAQQFLAAKGPNRPLIPGTYYVGVLAGSAQPADGSHKTASYTLRSRGIAASGTGIEVLPVPLDGGSAVTGSLAPREFQLFSVTIPAGAAVPSWRLDLSPSVGEMLMQVRRDSIPDFTATALVGETTPSSKPAGGKRLKRTGGESLVLLPENGESSLTAGTYFIAAVSEGAAPTSSALGSGQASGTLTSGTPVPSIDLGVASAASPLTRSVTLAAGDLQIYKVSVPSGMKVLEAYLSDRVGNPGLSIIRGSLPPLPFPGSTSGNNGYGWVGGQTTSTHPVLVTVQDPAVDEYTIVVRANPGSTSFEQSSATLNIRLTQSLPQIDPVNGSGTVVVTDQIAESWRYFELNIPADSRIKGIRVSLKNISSGVPRMIIRKGTQMPTNFTSTSGLSSASAEWLTDQQWYQTSDFTGVTNDSGGISASGRHFLAAYNAPMTAGTYIIGVSKNASVNTVNQPDTPAMSYSVVAEAVGEGLDLPVTDVDFDNSAAPVQIVDLPEREMAFYQVAVPTGQSSWRLHLHGEMSSGSPPLRMDGGLAVRKGQIPAFDAGKDPHAGGGANVKIVAQDDHWTLLPTSPNVQIDSGVYFIAVTSFGTGPTTSRTGADPSSLTLHSNGELPVTVLPVLSETQTQVFPYNLGPAELSAMEFTVPEPPSGSPAHGLALDILRMAGKANYSLIKVAGGGPGLPKPPGVGDEGFFGGLPYLTFSTDDIGGRIFAEIEPGTYRLIVRSSGSTYGPSSGTIGARLLVTADIPELQFDGENLNVTNAGATLDILQYRVEIPDEPNWQAWGIRLEGDIKGRPGIIIRRGLPVENSSGLNVNSDMIDWPLGYQWIQADDFTKLKNDPLTSQNDPDRDRSQQFFMASRDRPLQPGTYYIGIDNRGTSVISPRTFTIRTFAVGDGYSVPLVDLSEIGAESPIEISTPRMPRVYKISVPAMTKAWAVSVNPTIGDFTLRARFGSVPDPVNDTLRPDLKGGVHIQKSGDDRVTLLPNPGSDYLQEGDYYFMAVSEGQNSATNLIGLDEAVGTIHNIGPIAAIPLGQVSDAGLSRPVELAAAEVQLFTVDVPVGINNLEFRLRDRIGEASLAIIRGSRIPAPGITESYGVFGGETAGGPLKDPSIINLGNPLPGTYTIVVRAAGKLPSSYAPASANLAINVIKPSPLNFAQEQNAGNGLSNIDHRTLSDKEKFIYRVPVPSQIGGQPVLGWLLTLDEGNPTVRVYQNENDFGKTASVTMIGRTALIVPPLLTFDSNWFVEVEGVGATEYTLRSEPVRLTAAPWTLPNAFNQIAGDSSAGEPDGQGIGRELPQDAWEFFAIDVSENNLGLLRLALEQYGGNTNVYISNTGIPTPDHSSNGPSGTKLYQYRMIAETSEAGNFSEVSDTVKQPDRLTPGRWYVGVKSEPLAGLRTGSTYRLKAHSGVVTDLDLTTSAPLTDQNISERDWRYYRFTIPRAGIPAEWRPFFSRISGSSVAYIRDTLPPFSYTPNNSSTVRFIDWGTDLKNKAPTSAYAKALNPGTHVLAPPPLRPGASYFLGIFGNTSGGSVSVASSVSPQSVVVDADLAYDSGEAAITVPANASRLLRVSTTSDATRLKIECQQSAPGLSLKLEQGSLPYTASVTTAHKQNAAPYPVYYAFNETLGSSWPFVPNQDYYLLMTNTTAAPITSTVLLRGSSLTTEDEDNDGLLDYWEILHFGNLAQVADGDFDEDGSTNLQEFHNGTLPKNAASVRYLLTVESHAGNLTVSPALANYAPGDSVVLTASPAVSDTFREWKSNLPGLDGNPNASVEVLMNSNVSASAIFQTSVENGIDASSLLPITLDGAGQWYGQYQSSHDGVDAAVSPSLGTSLQSRIKTTVTGPGTLSYWWKVSSKANSGKLSLLIDNYVQTDPAPISGTTGAWAFVTVTIPAGAHSIIWRYSRDQNALTDGENRAYLDEVKFVPDGYVPNDYNVWKSNAFTLDEQADVLISGPDADADDDGLTNLVEAAIGTSPKDWTPPGLVLSLASASVAGGTRNIVLEANRAGAPVENLKLEIQCSPSMVDNSWVTLIEKTGSGNWQVKSLGVDTPSESPPLNGSVAVRIDEAVPEAESTRRFYRLWVTLLPPP